MMVGHAAVAVAAEQAAPRVNVGWLILPVRLEIPILSLNPSELSSSG